MSNYAVDDFFCLLILAVELKANFTLLSEVFS